MCGACCETQLVQNKNEERTESRETTSGDGETLFNTRPDGDVESVPCDC